MNSQGRVSVKPEFHGSVTDGGASRGDLKATIALAASGTAQQQQPTQASSYAGERVSSVGS